MLKKGIMSYFKIVVDNVIPLTFRSDKSTDQKKYEHCKILRIKGIF